MEQDLNAILQEQLRGIHIPEPVSWWPPAPGWWILFILALLLTGLSIWFVVRHQRNNRYRKQALGELQTIHAQWVSEPDSSLYVQSANAVIKRAMLAGSNEVHKASLTGQKWIDELNQWATQNPISEQSALALLEAGYRVKPEIDVNELHQQLILWLRSHKKPKSEGNIDA